MMVEVWMLNVVPAPANAPPPEPFPACPFVEAEPPRAVFRAQKRCLHRDGAPVQVNGSRQRRCRPSCRRRRSRRWP